MKFIFALTLAFLTSTAFATTHEQMNGYDTTLNIATPSDVWTEGGLYPFPTVAAATTIVSASANDTAAGTGARTVKISGLDANFQSIQETISLNGTTPVNLVGVYLRIQKVLVQTAGSGGTNAGKISVKQSSTTISTVVASAGRAQQAVFTAPANGGTWFVRKIFVAATNAVAGSVTFRLWTRKSGGVWQVRAVTSVYGTSKSSDQMEFMAPILLNAGEDARLEGTTTADSTAVAGSIEVLGGSISEAFK